MSEQELINDFFVNGDEPPEAYYMRCIQNGYKWTGWRRGQPELERLQ